MLAALIIIPDTGSDNNSQLFPKANEKQLGLPTVSGNKLLEAVPVSTLTSLWAYNEMQM